MPRIRALLPLLLLLLGLIPASPARAERDVDGLEEILPRRETQRERLRWLGREDEMPARMNPADPPPPAPIRNCAEWETCTGVLLRYPLGLPYDLLRDLDDDVILHVVVSSSYLGSAQTNLAANGVDMDRVQFLVKPNDSIWVRDYGPWFVFDGDDSLVIINHVYNRPYRPNDNLIPIYFGEQQGIPVYSHDMWHTGGNYMTDGAHISSSTRLVYDEAASANGMTQAEVDQLMLDYYGVENYRVLDYIESGGIHHIDTWAKFIDEETVLVKEVWPGHPTYDTLNQRATLLASLEASTGRNYQVYRVYCYDIGGSQPASYTNSLILNRTIYVPLFGSAAYDDDAMQTYRDAAPGYVVRGYDYPSWLSDDALHCRAKGVMDRRMLRIAHIPIRDPQEGPVLVSAEIEDHSGTGVSQAELHYRQGLSAWAVVEMTPVSGDRYEALIPAPASPTATSYYLHAESVAGRSAGMPRVEPDAWYSFDQSAAPSGVAELIARPPAPWSAPNPFRTETRFRFELAYPGHVELVVFDVHGRRVRRLLDGTQPAGPSEITWDGKDDAGRRLPAGVYQFRLRAAGIQYARPVTLLP
jgi:agmatine deiminase